MDLIAKQLVDLCVDWKARCGQTTSEGLTTETAQSILKLVFTYIKVRFSESERVRSTYLGRGIHGCRGPACVTCRATKPLTQALQL